MSVGLVNAPGLPEHRSDSTHGNGLCCKHCLGAHEGFPRGIFLKKDAPAARPVSRLRDGPSVDGVRYAPGTGNSGETKRTV